MGSVREMKMMQKTANEAEAHNDHLKYVGQVNEFITKTFDMIEYCHSKHQHIACWTEDGLQFIIKDTKLLESVVIPKYFNHNKSSSFFRQLNFYQFTKKNSSKKKIAAGGKFEPSQYIVYEHRFFKRDEAELLPRIKRSTYRKRKGDFSKDIDQFQKDLNVMNQEIDEMEENFQRAIKDMAASLDYKLSKLESILANKRRKLTRGSSNGIPAATSRYSSVDLPGVPLPTCPKGQRQCSDASLLLPFAQTSTDSIYNDLDSILKSREEEAKVNRQTSTAWMEDFITTWDPSENKEKTMPY